MREGRLGAPYEAPNEIVFSSGIMALRRFHSTPAQGDAARAAPPILLIPPLMVTAQVYDISPDLSAVGYLAGRGLDVYVTDFGSPEDKEGGLERTIDDHVLAVDAAVTFVRGATGRDVHIAGYSQGGMFAYLVGAYRQGRDVASIITFGSPVDMRRNLPVPLPEEAAARVLDGLHTALHGVFERLEGLPADFTSLAFKLISPRQELKYLLQTVGLLHNREALERREPKRRFLGGEGFVAWPGPAFRTLVTEFIARNRLASGGLVVAGRTVTLNDVNVPILYFVGRNDEVARPGSVRAVERAVSSAEKYAHWVSAGHFGLVVGSRAIGETWPLVADFIEWRAGARARPENLTNTRHVGPERTARAGTESAAGAPSTDGAATDSGLAGALARVSDTASDVRKSLSLRLAGLGQRMSGFVGALRWQMPRLAQLARLDENSRISFAAMLAEQAREIPEAPFFLWNGRAFTYAQANDRVSHFSRALHAAGVRAGTHVALLFDNHPRYTTVVCALNRLGAVAVLLPAEARGRSLEHALETSHAEMLIADARHAALARATFVSGPLLIAGQLGDAVLPEGALHLDEAELDRAPPLPASVEVDAGRAGDLAMLLFTSGTTGLPKAARVTNRRCALAGLGAAAACRLTPSDTVYCCLPLHHASGMLIACGGALAGGARLALAPRFSAHTFWNDVRRVGATVVVHVGEVCRYLVAQPASAAERHHPVRIFVGNGLRPEVWREMLERFGKVRIIEFYSSTEGNVLLANLTGDKVGAVGRGFGDDDGDLALVECDIEEGTPLRGADGRCLPVPPGTAGLLLSRIDPTHPLGHFDGYTDTRATHGRIVRDAFVLGDAWFNTGDLLRRDDDGDYWFVDRLGDTFRWKGENVSTAQVEATLLRLTFLSNAVVYGVRVPGREGRVGVAAVVLRDGAALDREALAHEVMSNLTPAARPRFLRVVPALEMTETFKVRRLALAEAGLDLQRIASGTLYFLNERAGLYEIASSPTDLERAL
jgi:putative long chain acyl-CoA synthase